MSSNLFQRVIRLNPDVIIYSETRLRRLMGQSWIHGVFSNCLQSFCDEYATVPCLDTRRYILMSDFFAFRPDKVRTNYPTWLEHRLSANDWAEGWTSTSFKDFISSGNFSWIQSYSNTSSCRIAQEDIGHSHERWWVKLDYILEGRTSCPGHDYSPCERDLEEKLSLE